MQFDIRRFDIYRKVPKDLTQPTLTGAIISIGCCFFIAFLFVCELKQYFTVEVVSRLTVDDPVKHTEKIPVFINITLPKLPCQYVGLDIQDDMGRHEVGFNENTAKFPLNEEKGCRFESNFLINKVPGNFHVSTHSVRGGQPDVVDMSHVIHKLRFGMELAEGKTVEGSFNPIEEFDKSNAQGDETHDYILRVVPTVYEDTKKNIRFPYQYTFIHREIMQIGHGGRGLPAIWFRYELSPITVHYVEKHQPFYTFLVMICAIIGGTFTVAGIIDGLVFSASELIKKAEIGKLS
ncbi:endoplasmic reticulum-Golgi intermediate compartment protein 1 [Aplysia californica]|uniref:Endoplasmic reticulum-Golgi intermediate compartment protein 1 n=1 Tax=Aplysia californica TaxID=6500 RepID=A0ABM1VW57_APLCA|nr:endoplasmic reticulum-Golgi intermediate compartment protein 1 [Aplysia californica]XP_035826649.1 endoplasmic reticulum-Golgi intermediate compartment protein 1 [Aplysia californica]